MSIKMYINLKVVEKTCVSALRIACKLHRTLEIKFQSFTLVEIDYKSLQLANRLPLPKQPKQQDPSKTLATPS